MKACHHVTDSQRDRRAHHGDEREIASRLRLGRSPGYCDRLCQRDDVDPAVGMGNWSHLQSLTKGPSALVIVGLLPLLKHSVDLLSTTGDRRIAFIVITLAMIAYSLCT